MSKYGNRKTNGYASKREANRAGELAILQAGGVITDLEEQKRYVLIPAFQCKGKKYRDTTYVADFTYFMNGERVVEDVKGVRTPMYQLKKKLMAWAFEIEITEI